MRAVERAGHTVNPAKAESLLHGVVVGDTLFTGSHCREDEQYLRLRLEMLGEPLAPLSAIVGSEGVHDILKSATISAGVTTLGELGKCLILPVTK